MTRSFLIVASLAVLGFSSQGLAQDDAQTWLSRMTHAAQHSNYTGVVVYRTGEMMETLKLTHGFRDGQPRERMVSLSGEAREILRIGDEVMCILPAENKMTVDKRGKSVGLFPTLPKDGVKALQNWYQIEVTGRGRTAGRESVAIRVEPRDLHRYGYEFWIDVTTGVPLRLSLINQQGGVLEQMMFSSIEYPATIPDSEFRSQQDTSKYERVVQMVKEAADNSALNWQVAKLPPGFQLMMRDFRELPGSEERIEHLLFSDGLASVSVYTAPVSAEDKPFQGASHMGAVSAYGRVVGDWHITVVGEVPVSTVEMIASGLSRIPDSAAKPAAK